MTSLEYYTTLTSTRRRCYFVACWTWFSARLIVGAVGSRRGASLRSARAWERSPCCMKWGA
jgi:hypothetical protein